MKNAGKLEKRVWSDQGDGDRHGKDAVCAHEHCELQSCFQSEVILSDNDFEQLVCDLLGWRQLGGR